jgi:hypothetical protein
MPPQPRAHVSMEPLRYGQPAPESKKLPAFQLCHIDTQRAVNSGLCQRPIGTWNQLTVDGVPFPMVTFYPYRSHLPEWPPFAPQSVSFSRSALKINGSQKSSSGAAVSNSVPWAIGEDLR